MGGKSSKPKKPEKKRRRKKTVDLHFKVLCLGPGESGKSTLIKQLKMGFLGDELSDDEAKEWRNDLHINTLTSIHNIINYAREKKVKLSKEVKAASKRLLKCAKDEVPLDEWEVTPELANDVVTLWEDETIQKVYRKRSKFFLLDGASYYFDNVQRFAESKYLPTNEDVIMARARTTGIISTTIKDDPVKWTVVDVGGQRSERAKWVKCFDDVKAISFCVNLAGFASPMYEDPKKRRIVEALELFEEMVNLPLFVETPFFVFFNKRDLLEVRLKQHSMKEAFKDYDGKEKDADAALEFLEGKFKEQLGPKRNAPVTFFCIVSKDTNAVKGSFDQMKEVLSSFWRERMV